MNIKGRSLSTYSFILALFSVVIVVLASRIYWFEWQIMIEDLGKGYKVEILTNKLTTHETLDDIDIPNHIARIYSSKGECWWGNTELVISPSDRWKEKWLVRIFRAVVGASYIVALISFSSLIWCWWRKHFKRILFLLAASGVFLILSHVLGPKTSMDPDFSSMDFYCRFDLVLKANMISINPLAIVTIMLSTVLGLISVYLLTQVYITTARE